MKQIIAIIGLGLLAGASIMFFGGDKAGTYGNETPMNENNDQSSLTLSSTAFESGGAIPSQYTCDGERTMNPPLSISNVPSEAKSLVLVMDDPDIPQVFKDERGIDSFDHWVVYGIPPDTTEIKEGAVVGALGMNGREEAGYTGPCPPPEYEPTTHRYIFKLYALSGTLQFIKAPTKAEVLAAIQGMILDEAELIGTYDRSGN